MGKYEGRHRKRPVVENDQYTDMLVRMHIAFSKRIGEDPDSTLPQVRRLEDSLRDAVNAGIFVAATHPDEGPPYSLTQMAGDLDVSRQAIAKRARLGEQVVVRMQAERPRSGLVRLVAERKARRVVQPAAERGPAQRRDVA